MRVRMFALSVLAGIVVAAGAFADQARDKAAKRRAIACNDQATVYRLEGEKLKAFMKTCLASEGPVTAIDEPLSPAERAKRCAVFANSKSLTGERRDQFVQSCVAGK